MVPAVAMVRADLWMAVHWSFNQATQFHHTAAFRERFVEVGRYLANETDNISLSPIELLFWDFSILIFATKEA